jgi:hypothetical protein
MSQFIITPDDQIIGYSVWPWDALYLPLVGVFDSGVMVCVAACELTPEELTSSVVRLPLRSRIKRRLLRAVGRPMPAPPVDLAAFDERPTSPVWFRAAAPEPLAARIRAGDPNVRLERLEDSTPIRQVGEGPSAALPHPARVEQLLQEPPQVEKTVLDGFLDFLSSPFQHQLEVAFVEYLRRMPEQGARDAYLPQLESRAITIFDLRRFIVTSEEFRSRRIGFGSRLGVSLVTPLWAKFKREKTLLEPHRALPTFDSADLDALSEDAFVALVSDRMLGRAPTVLESAEIRRLSALASRSAAAREMSRWAARRGDYVVVG